MTKKHEPRSSSCMSSCIFEFRSDEPKKFPEEEREEAASSLVYEAEARLRDPVYGCLGAITQLQRKMIEPQYDLAVARASLAWNNIDGSAILNFDEDVSVADFGEFPCTRIGGLNKSFGTSSFSNFQPLHGE